MGSHPGSQKGLNIEFSSMLSCFEFVNEKEAARKKNTVNSNHYKTLTHMFEDLALQKKKISA